MKIGDYELRYQLNRGGMALLFLAQRLWADGKKKMAVIKIPTPNIVVDPRLAMLALDEAKVAMELDHPNIVSVWDAGIHEGLPWFAMAYVPGVNLAELIRAVAKAENEFDFEVAAHVTREVAYALQFAHEYKSKGVPQNIVHRDVAPKNVMVSASGDVLLTDFGVASARWVDSTNNSVKGTFRNMAPEHALGHATQKSDAFGLGTILWSMLEGRDFRWDVPNEGLVTAALDGYITASTREGIPPLLQKVLDGLLEIDERRRMTIGEAIELLEKFTTQRSTLKKMMARYFGEGIGASGHTSVGFQSSEELEQALKIAKITRGEAPSGDVLLPKAPPSDLRESEVRRVEATIDVSAPAAMRARDVDRPAAVSGIVGAVVPPRVEPTVRLPNPSGAASGPGGFAVPPASAAERPKAEHVEPAAPSRTDGVAAPRPSSDPAAVAPVHHSPTGERLVPSVRPAPRRRSVAATLMVVAAVFLLTAFGVGLTLLALREDPKTVANMTTEPTREGARPSAGSESVAVVARPEEAEPEPLVLRDDEPVAEDPKTTSDPEPSMPAATTEPAEVPAEASASPAEEKRTKSSAPGAPVPKVAVQVALGFVPRVDVQLGGRTTHTLTRDKDKVTVQVPAGQRTLRWRLAPADPWSSTTVDLLAGYKHFVLIEKSGPRFPEPEKVKGSK